MGGHDPQAVRRDFSSLAPDSAKRRLVYLDSAATALVPEPVIEAVTSALRAGLGNPSRGVHGPSERATAALERARHDVQRFLNAEHASELVFTRGTTDSINLVAQAYAAPRLGPGDEVVVSELEHHANLLPWQQVCARTGATLRVAPITERGQLTLEAFERVLGERTRIVAVAHVSNVLGCVAPVAQISARAHALGAVVLVDGAQAVAHLDIDVQALGCDFYAFSGHKLHGPGGIGVLWARASLLSAMEPHQLGGGMVARASFEGFEPAPPPARFEAGTPNVTGAIGLAAAIDYLEAHDRVAIAAHERALLARLRARLAELTGARVLGDASGVGVVSFVLEDVHAHDVGTLVAAEGVAVRTGHHCAQPLMTRLGLPATVRASVGLYNDDDDVDALIEALHRVRTVLP